MRVEGQGMALDRSALKAEVVKSVVAEQPKDDKAMTKTKQENSKDVARVNEDEIAAATEVMNKAMKISNYHVEFKMHKESGRFQVKLIDTDTDEVIREIPAESILEFSAKFKAMLDKMIGVLVDELI